jgi:release factor glutamine methyltransferase
VKKPHLFSLLETELGKKEGLFVWQEIFGKHPLFFCEQENTPFASALIKEIIKQRKKNIPLAYVLGYQNFFGYNFFVNENTLIPRVETERLIEHIQERECSHKQKILDLGCGSGCIGITLSLLFPNWEITLSDISKDALKVAKYNAKLHKKSLLFLESNLLENISSSFDIIVANLPYLPETWKHPSTEKEPDLALYSGKDGLSLLQKLSKELQKNLPFVLYVEADASQISKLKTLFSFAKKIETLFDLQKQERFLRCEF